MTLRLLHSAVLAAILPTMAFTAILAQAQREPLPLGSVDQIVQLKSCPSGYFSGMTCFHGEVNNCADDSSLGFTYGYENPDGTSLGTVAFLEGGGGISGYVDPEYAQTYLDGRYQVVYISWDSDWEMTSAKSATSIKSAACRPATALNYVYDHVYSRGAMCAQGFSAGSGALGYALAWYGSDTYLDDVELLSGPVFGDIEQGCEVPNKGTLLICPPDQFGCDGKQWPDSPLYVDGDQTLVRKWSGQQSCNAGKTTPGYVNSLWKAMSIVDGTNNPNFSYPHTSMAGYLCSNADQTQNNSAAQGEFFYQQFTSPNQTAGYSLTRINNCQGAEGVTTGTTPDGESGFTAITNHMLSSCVRRHNAKTR